MNCLETFRQESKSFQPNPVSPHVQASAPCTVIDTIASATLGQPLIREGLFYPGSPHLWMRLGSGLCVTREPHLPRIYSSHTIINCTLTTNFILNRLIVSVKALFPKLLLRKYFFLQGVAATFYTSHGNQRQRTRERYSAYCASGRKKPSSIKLLTTNIPIPQSARTRLRGEYIRKTKEA